ncbi:MAG TPA: M15 family metallopeptidase [Gammaproteobacteria bacterium]|nr:M15 family metallopeptidase [Gammaproteobacteria bacterium]
MAGPDAEIADAVAAIHRELGIPADYAAARGWPLQPEAEGAALVSIGADVLGREQRLIAPAAAAWRKLQATAAADEVVLQPVSAFRAVAYQVEVIRRKLAAGRSIEDILQVNAVPGYSEHHTGRALDITTPGVEPLDESFEATAAFVWLAENAGRFGFRLSYPRDNALGMAFEPWHWAYALR